MFNEIIFEIYEGKIKSKVVIGDKTNSIYEKIKFIEHKNEEVKEVIGENSENFSDEIKKKNFIIIRLVKMC